MFPLEGRSAVGTSMQGAVEIWQKMVLDVECNTEGYHCPRICEVKMRKTKYKLLSAFRDGNSLCSVQVLGISQFVCGFTLSELCIIFILTQLRFQSQSQISA